MDCQEVRLAEELFHSRNEFNVRRCSQRGVGVGVIGGEVHAKTACGTGDGQADYSKLAMSALRKAHFVDLSRMRSPDGP